MNTKCMHNRSPNDSKSTLRAKIAIKSKKRYNTKMYKLSVMIAGILVSCIVLSACTSQKEPTEEAQASGAKSIAATIH